MKQFPAGYLTRKTGDLFEVARVAPVAITKHRKPRFVVMSMERFEAMTAGPGSQVALDVADMPEELGKMLTRVSSTISVATDFPKAGQVFDDCFL
jgi:hypothetical protein